MRIASIRLRNFKRFTDLSIQGIPSTAKLVVVVGPNGCGKSSIFDAFLQWYRNSVGFGVNTDQAYYKKDTSQDFDWVKSVEIETHGVKKPQKGSLYVRTAYRNDPDFNISNFSRPATPSEQVRVERSIQNDQTVSDNYQRLIYDTLSGVYEKGNNAKKVEELREELIGEVQASMKRVFRDLELNSISDPLGSGAFFFAKGTARAYHYKNLSGGEKAAFDLLLDMHVKKRYYSDSIYCIDEVEAHLHTRVQGALLKELVNTLPGESQLWVTTHSLGVLRAAQEMAKATPGLVCVIDFDFVNSDEPREVLPSNLGRVSLGKMLSLLLGDLSERIAPKVIVVCEGSSTGNRRKDFDADVYNRILGSQYPDILFISGGGSNEVGLSGKALYDALRKVFPAVQIRSLVDRDDRTPEEVCELEVGDAIVLPLRNLESYLMADDVIQALLVREGKANLSEQAIQIKQQAIASSVARKNPQDDMKSAAGEIYIGLRKLLGLQRCGNDTNTFMRDTLAGLITPQLDTYRALKTAIIDRVD